MKLKDVSIILMFFGLAVILNSFLDFYSLLFPLVLKNSEWVYEVSQRIAGVILFPLLGIIIYLLGVNFSGLRRSRKFVYATRAVMGTLCVLICLFLSFNTVMYGISMKAVTNNKIEELKAENSASKERINTVYVENKTEIPVEKYKTAIKQLNDELIYQINYLNLIHTKINVKTLMGLFIFSFVYLIASIKIFSLDRLFKKRRALAKCK